MNDRIHGKQLEIEAKFFSRRTLLRGVLSLSVAGLLASWGGDDDDSPAPTTTTESVDSKPTATTATDDEIRGSPSPDQVYIASSRWMTDLRYFRDLGLDVIDHGTDDFFELLSWEQLNKYSADLILIDARAGSLTSDEPLEMEVWSTLPAVQADQVGPWYAGAPYSHKRFAPIMQELTEIIRTSRADIV